MHETSWEKKDNSKARKHAYYHIQLQIISFFSIIKPGCGLVYQCIGAYRYEMTCIYNMQVKFFSKYIDLHCHVPKLNRCTRPLRSSNLKQNEFPRPREG